MANPSGVGHAARGLRRVARAHPPQLPVCRLSATDPQALVEHVWIITNGIGGYSSSTVAGIVTRRYHGLLVAALSNPADGRAVLEEAERLARDAGR